ncbi:MAG TPA: hypothetical protein VHF69_14860 [Candidatus Synoicihabitans sp.]|nr:hypothetical protein [Candidatus Synoicihabitans sp.]
MPAEKPLAYIVLGATGSGRREVVADLIDAGFANAPEARPVVLLAENELPAEIDARLPEVWRWRLVEGTIVAELPPDATHVFFVVDGRANPIDQIEALKPWLGGSGLELARVVCVVSCRLAEAHPPLLTWYDACVHFSDVVLLNRREGVGNKWFSDFRARYDDQFLPCLIEVVKAGRVKNPALVLEPEARRLSHYFDDEAEWAIEGDDEDEVAEGDEEVTAAPVEDPYLQRRAGGRRVKEIPDVVNFLHLPSPQTG